MNDLDEIPYAVKVREISVLIPPSEVGRHLPSREVTRETIADAYAGFILFCNPSFSDQHDLFALKATFGQPPTSSKKCFDTFDVYCLIKRFYEHDIRTWQQLAVLLGVDNSDDVPESIDASGDPQKGRNQKVSQYIVRLKRWMKLTHIDAFFQYLIGRAHDYYQIIPPLSDPFPPEGRDGVLTPDDMALKALDPKLRPKRGRKRLNASMDELPPAQRHTFSTVATPDDHHTFVTPATAFPPSAFPSSAVPPSAFPHSSTSDYRQRDPWPSTNAAAPRSAVPGVQSTGPTDSARTPRDSGKVYKWRNSHSTSSPIQRRADAAATPVTKTPKMQPIDTADVPRQHPADVPTSAVSAISTASRPGRQRLQLQVPPHEGGPVSLMPHMEDGSGREPDQQDWRLKFLELEKVNAALRRSLEQARNILSLAAEL